MQKLSGKPLLDVLEKHWCLYRKRLKACRQNTNEDNVHDLRVGIRRLLTLIDLLHALQPQPTLVKIRKSLKNQLDGFDELRDTQVMLFEAAKTLPILPELEPFLAFMHAREQHLLLENQSFVASLYQPKLRRKIKKAGKRFKIQTADTDLSLALPAVIDEIHAVAINRYHALDPTDLASIHHLRISVKKLRYTLMSVQSIIAYTAENHADQLQIHTTLMGDIQNSTVLIQTLEAFFGINLPSAIKQYYQQQQQDQISAFMAHCQETPEFWR